MFYWLGTFTIDVQYEDVTKLQAPTKINTYTVLDGFGMISVAAASAAQSAANVIHVGTEDITSKVEVRKNKVKKTNIPITEFVYEGLSPAVVEKSVEKEFEMALLEQVIEENKDKKNVMEAYVYDMRKN